MSDTTGTSGKQSVRQQAREAIRDRQRRLREQRAVQERRCAALGVQVAAALAERDAHIAACEAQAATALRALIDDEGLPVGEAIEWCGGKERLPMPEATRLRRLTPQPQASDETPTDPAGRETAEEAAPDAAPGEAPGEAPAPTRLDTPDTPDTPDALDVGESDDVPASVETAEVSVVSG